MSSGEQIFVHPAAVIIGDVKVGKCSSIWPCAVLRGDFNSIIIGEYSSIQDNCVLHPTPFNRVDVGNYVTVGHGAVLQGCKVENDVLIGMNSTILDGSVIGSGSVVGAGALIRENLVVPPGSLVVGVPGKILEGKGNAELNHQNALLYFELALKHLRGEIRMGQEEFLSLMQKIAGGSG